MELTITFHARSQTSNIEITCTCIFSLCNEIRSQAYLMLLPKLLIRCRQSNRSMLYDKEPLISRQTRMLLDTVGSVGCHLTRAMFATAYPIQSYIKIHYTGSLSSLLRQ